MAPTAANAYTDPAVISVSPSVAAPGGVATFTTDRAAYQGDEEIIVSVTGASQYLSSEPRADDCRVLRSR
jgi:hypothetical protein